MQFLPHVSYWLLAGSALAVQPLVNVTYAEYKGVALKNGITQWLGMRFAAPPVGNLRFRAPKNPVQQHGVQAANKYGPLCLPVYGGPPDNTTSEDCLTLNVFAPSNASPTSKLPVFFFIQGGGFAANSNPYLNGSGLIKAADGNLIVVTSNYRVGPYGFLASEEVSKDGSINNGLKDQRKAMQWVQRHISKVTRIYKYVGLSEGLTSPQFGGDPGHVVIDGDSAGGQSIAMHLTAYGGRNDGLFIGAIGESVSTPTMLDVKGSQFAYDNLVLRAGCIGADTLGCLRNLSAAKLQTYNIVSPFPNAENDPLYLYGPTIDHDLVPDYTYKLFMEGRIIHVPTIMGDDTNGGTIFTPKTASNYSDSDTFIHDQFPNLSLAQLAEINKLYPVIDFPQNFPNSGPFWRQTSQAYADMRYKCPGTYFSTSCAIKQPATYAYRYNVLDPTQAAEGYGVPHTVEVNAIFGPENVPDNDAPKSYYPGHKNAAIVPQIQAYWTSFIRTLDPNVHRLKGSPKWERWTGENQRRFLFETEAKSKMETVSAVEQKRCKFYNGIGIEVGQ